MAIFGTPPSDYYSRQDANKAQKFRDIMNLFMQMRQMGQQKEQFGISTDLQSRGLDIEEKRAEYMGPYYRGRTEDMAAGPDPTTIQRDIDRLIKEGVVGSYEEGLEYQRAQRIGTPEEARERGYSGTQGQQQARIDFPTPTRPDQYDRRKADLQAAVDSGRITQAQMDSSLHGIGAKLADPGDNDSKRNSNATQYRMWTEDTFGTAPKMKEEARKLYRDTGQVPIYDGHRLDMPQDYNLGLQNMRDGIATEHDESVVRKYDHQFETWQKLKAGLDIKDKDGNITGTLMLKDFKEFMAYISNPRNGVKKDAWDRDRVRIWYDIYKRTKEYK